MFLYLVFYMLLGCNAWRLQTTTNDVDDASVYVKLENFPSRDTIAILYYKKKVWYKVAYSKVNLKPLTPPQKCESCAVVFGKDFFDSLLSIEDEDNLTNDCTIYIDTLLNGVKNRSINNFYNITNLQKETISVRIADQTKSINYLEPRLALRYCKQNAARLNFIEVSEVLRRL